MPCELARARKFDNRVRGAGHFIRELARQENRRLRNTKIRRPLFRFVYATQERRVFFGREIGVELRAERRMHQVGMALRAVRLISAASSMPRQ